MCEITVCVVDNKAMITSVLMVVVIGYLVWMEIRIHSHEVEAQQTHEVLANETQQSLATLNEELAKQTVRMARLETSWASRFDAERTAWAKEKEQLLQDIETKVSVARIRR